MDVRPAFWTFTQWSEIHPLNLHRGAFSSPTQQNDLNLGTDLGQQEELFERAGLGQQPLGSRQPATLSWLSWFGSQVSLKIPYTKGLVTSLYSWEVVEALGGPGQRTLGHLGMC